MQAEEVCKEDLSSWIYKEEGREQPLLPLPIDEKRKGYQLVKNMGFTGQGSLSLHGQGRREPIIMEKFSKNLGLGYGSSNVIIPTIESTSYEEGATSTTDETSNTSECL